MNISDYWATRRKEETRKLEQACGKAKAHRLIKEMEARAGDWNDRTWANQLIDARNKVIMEGLHEAE